MKPTYTYEQDKWLDANVNLLGRRWDDITEAFNLEFGADRNVKSLQNRTRYLCIPNETRCYTKEQNRWIQDHSYMEREVMTRKFNERFGASRTRRAIEEQCANIKAYKLYSITKEYRRLCHWTKEKDGWLRDNVRVYRFRHADLTKELNHRFGSRYTERAVRNRIWSLGLKVKDYFPEEEKWLIDHKDMGAKELTMLFNDTFNEKRSVECLRLKVSRLLTGRKKSTSDASDAKRHETTAPSKNDKGETIL